MAQRPNGAEAPAETRLVCHHVGGRGFGVAFNCPPRFDQDLAHVLYEADAECAGQMVAENARGNVFVLPHCLGGADGQVPFFITKNPYGSSNLEPDPVYLKYYCEVMLHGEIEGVSVQNALYDAIYEKENEVVRRVEVPVRSLDSLAAEGALPLGAGPDFLSLDTQGSEHNILEGARATVDRSVLGIATEIEFHAMYRSQKLFSAILDFADRHGFHFAGFTYLQEISPYRAPLGQRGKGFLAFGDALFLRRLETLDGLYDGEEARHLGALKLAFVALNFGYVEYALQALSYAMQRQIGPAFAHAIGARGYVGLLKELHAAAKTMKPLYLHTDRLAVVKDARTRAGRDANQRLIEQQAQVIASQSIRITEQIGVLDDLHRRVGEQQQRLANLAQTDPRRVIRRLARRPLRSLRLLLGLPVADDGTAPPPPAQPSAATLLPQFIAVPPAPTPPPPPAPVEPETAVEEVLARHGYQWLEQELRRRRLAALPYVPEASSVA